MKHFIIVLYFVLFSNFSNACDCIETISLESEIAKADVIISGKIISREFFTKKNDKVPNNIYSQVKYKILVKAILKGKSKNKILTILTGRNGGSDFGYQFQLGKNYIIYANRENKFLVTSICTKTDIFSENVFDVIRKYCKQKGYS